MKLSKTYKVIIPYTESSNPRKTFKIEYTVEALDRTSALERAEREFNSYADYNSASWIRTINSSQIRIWNLLEDMPQTPACIDKLAEKLSSDDEDVLYNSLKALGKLEDSSPSSQIIALLKHKNTDIVALAIETLAKIGDPSNLNVIKSLYKPEASPKIKSCILTATGRLARADDNTFDFLTRALGEEDPRIRANAVEAIEMLGLADTARLLFPMLEDEDNRVRANVIKALWNKHDQRDLLKVIKDMTSSNSPWMQASAVFVLANVKVPGRVDLLAALCLEEHPKVSENAKIALFNLNCIECLPYWVEIISNEKEFEIVAEKTLSYGEQAISALLAINPQGEKAKEHVSALLDMLEEKVLKTSGWIEWLKTRKKRIFGK